MDAEPNQIAPPDRVSWGAFPAVILHAPVPLVKGHVDYLAAKSGNAEAAARLVHATISTEALAAIEAIAVPSRAMLVSVHAIEELGTNAIPEALARAIAERCRLDIDESIVQTNVVNHTGASGYWRLASQALFDGDVLPGRNYVMVDDFVAQGGTMANLRGFIEKRGGRVVLAVSLTGKPHSAKLAPDADQAVRLRKKHGNELENWWKNEFGFGFDLLTASEARYLESTADAEQIRNRIAEAKQARHLGSRQSGVGGAKLG